MRMTNKIMQNNSLYNINNNKILQDKLSTMMSTEKKITRPSDDPVIAIRALRLRTSVSELTQFYTKNAPDANSWLDVTGKSLSKVTDVLTDLSKQANKGANKDLGPEDLEIIIQQMKSLRDEFYSTGNVDYAGRYVFTGYRTDTTMSFTEEIEEAPEGYPSYKITEQNTIQDFDVLNYTDIGNLAGLNKSNYTDASYAGIVEQDIRNGDIHRMRLSYDDLVGTAPDAITGAFAEGDLTIMVGGVAFPIKAQTVPLAQDPYLKAMNDNIGQAESVIFIPETGEILFSDKAYAKMEADVNAAGGNSTEIQLTYTKNEWKDGDLRPEHYFACEETNLDEGGNPKTVHYNQKPVPKLGADGKPMVDGNGDPVYETDAGGNTLYVPDTGKRQTIEYDVGYNQKIQVNTTADEVFGHGLDRDIDDLELALKDLKEMYDVREDMKTLFKEQEEGTPEYDDLKKKYDAAEKAYSYLREKIHNMFGGTITKVQGYLDDTNVAITDNGTRSQRLSLVSTRLMDQKNTYKTLQSENEDADIAEVAVQLTSTELTYEAALMATGKIMQTSLMNYI